MKLKDADFFSIYVFVIIFYLISAVFNLGNFSDWLLNGVFYQTVFFVIISIVLFYNIKSNQTLSVMVALFVLVLNILPGLRYPLFYGVFDSPGHYSFSNSITILGHIPQNQFYSGTYGGNPGMHLTLAGVSLITDLSMNLVFKFVAPALFSFFPLIIYFIGHKILDKTALKYSLLSAALPALSSYEVWGTSLAFIVYFLLGALFLRLVLFKIETRFLVTFFLLSFMLIISHAITSLFFLLILLGILIFLIVLARIRSAVTSMFSFATIGILAVFYGLLLIVWWSTFDTINLKFFTDVVAQIFQQEMPVVSVTFYNLSLISRFQTLIVLNSANAVVLLLSVVGFWFFIRYVDRIEKISSVRFFYWFVIGWVGVITLFLVVQLVANFGLFSYQRLLIYAIPWCTFFIGLSLSYLDSKLKMRVRFKKIVFILMTLLLVFTCLIQFYPYQPLIPKDAELSESLPKSGYVVDLTLINTNYQVSMISFANKYSTDGLVLADLVTRSQTYGFSDPSFFSRIVYSSPLVSPDLLNENWTLLLLHYGKAGPFRESLQYRTDEYIQNFTYLEGSVVYDNGASFIMAPNK